jgi:hypothetical protein
LKEEREWLVFSSKEREFRLRPILAIKMDDFGFNGFLLMSKV